MTSIIAKWQSLSKKEKMTGEERNAKAEGPVAQMNDKNETPGTSTQNFSMLFILIGSVKLRMTSKGC